MNITTARERALTQTANEMTMESGMICLLVLGCCFCFILFIYLIVILS